VAARAGLDVPALRSRAARVGERPFDSERKRMATVHRTESINHLPGLAGIADSEYVALVKGAVDGLLTRTTAAWTGTTRVELTDERRARVIAANDELAAAGIRGLDDREQLHEAEDGLTLLGLVGIIDPPRPEATDAVALCGQAGIRAVMITGDHPLTAAAIAQQIGITSTGGALTGSQLDRMSDHEIATALDDTSVFARVSPEHKLRLVRALREKGHVVAMTGDGVNDAPALKQADIGVAMGITGTDVSKEAADMVLRDDNFASIVAAVKEGRVIYDNLRRFVKFAVAGNVGKIIVMLVWPLPFLITGDADDAVALLPLQLLWLNLMTDGLLGLSMGVEGAEEGVMRRPPHATSASIWAGGLGRQATWVGAVIGFAALAVGYAYHRADAPEWQTMIFTSLAFLQVFQALGSRSSTESLKKIGLRSNPTMLWLIGAVVGLQLGALYTPLNRFLDVEPLGPLDLALCLGLGAGLLMLLEADKWRRRRAGT
jgi:Ca2+-transporting ATPase